MGWGTDDETGDDLHDPAVVRAREHHCCRAATESDVEHAMWHYPMGFLPRWQDGELYLMETTFDRAWDQPPEEAHWFAIAGRVERRQPGPRVASWDLYVERVDGVGITLHAYDDEPVPADFDTLVREFVITRMMATPSSRGTIVKAQRPDPLFRLDLLGQLWFDARWPLPDGSKPLRTITGSKASAGWTDIAAAHDCLDHVSAIGSSLALIGALDDTARQRERWGGVVITRGGGGTPGMGGDWLTPFDDPDAIEAVRRVQDTGLPVLVAIGHEADRCGIEAAADFSWATPSLLGQTLADWRSYLIAELASPSDAMSMATYSLGRTVRQAFDDAWLRTREGHEFAKYMFPERSWRAS